MNRGTAGPALLALAGVATIVGCADGDRGGAEVTRRDSAGLEIVESAVAADSPVELGELRLEIGRVQGPEPYQLHDVSSAVRLSTGEIVATNTGTNELRFYDSAGVHLASTPGTGDGPGEFTDLHESVRIPGDSLVAYSAFGWRIFLFDSDGRFVRELHPSVPDAQSLAARGGFPDGTLVVSGLLGDWSSSALETGLYHGSEVWVTFGRDGSLRDTLGRFPWSRGTLYQYHGGMGWGMQRILTFAGRTTFSFSGSRLFIGDGRRPEVSTLAADGSVERILRWDARGSPLTEEFVASFRERLLSGQEDPVWRERYEEALEALPFPDSLPVYEALEATPSGGLWVKAYSPRHAEGPETWWVFAPSGRNVGRVRVPRGYRVTQVDEDAVLGIHTDELGVQRVRVYERPGLGR